MSEPVEDPKIEPVIPTEEPKVPETLATPKEEPKSTETPTTPEVEEEEVELDTTQIEAEVTKKVTEKLLKSLTGGSEEEVTKVTGEQSPWAKEGRNPKDYDEIAEWTTQLALKKQEEAKAQEEETKKQEEENTKKAQEERATSFNKYWDNQMVELQEEGDLPPITDPNDKKDLGVIARKGLFEAMIAVNEERTKAGKEPIYSLTDAKILQKFRESQIEPGMSAPVSAGRGTVPTEGDDYEYVGKKSFFDILMRR